MPGVLVLDGHSRAAMEVTQSLGRAGLEVSVSSNEPEPIAFSSRYARQKFEQPSAIPVDAFIEWLQRLDAQFRFQLIVPSTESSLQSFLALSEDDSLRRRAVLPSNHALRAALDRTSTWKLASDLDVPIPATRLIDRLPAESASVEYPLILKPARSKSVHNGELKTYSPAIALDVAARLSVLEEWVPRMAVLEQEYVSGWGFGIELLYDSGRPVWHFAHERLHEWPLTGGASTYRRAIEAPPEMLAASQRMLDALEWNGVAMVEFKRRSDGSFALMEINPRLWGSLALSIDAGVDFPLGLWRLAIGEPLPPQPAYRRGMRTRNLSGDLVWQKANLFADRANPLLLTRPRLNSLLEPLLVFTGKERWDHFSWSDLGPIRGEIVQIARLATRARSRRRQIGSLLRRRADITQSAVDRVNVARASGTPSIVFLCHGNICRSPFAALLARDRLTGCEVKSGGLDPRANRPTPSNVKEVAATLGCDMSACRSTPITDLNLRTADLVLLMDVTQYEHVARAFPECVDRVVPLGLFADPPVVEIEDPDRRDAAATRRILLQIASAIDSLAQRIGRGATDEGGSPVGIRHADEQNDA